MICHKCQETIPEISRYCLHCGVLLNRPATVSCENESDGEQIDWDKRILCSDGSCIGTIENGRCTVCGMPGTPELS